MMVAFAPLRAPPWARQAGQVLGLEAVNFSRPASVRLTLLPTMPYRKAPVGVLAGALCLLPEMPIGECMS